MALASGTVLARRYRILAPLGEGGMGSVYQAEDLQHPGQVWAIKELLDDSTLSVEDLAWATRRFDDEIALMARLAHPRIPRYSERFTEGKRRYFVMEYIPGTTLEQRLERAHAPLPEADVLRWMRDLCEVLTYLHGQRPPIVVRDLKPGNIMLTPQGEIRLIDFGIARTYKAGKASNTENLGTMTYASPEHHGHAQTDARSDLYSLGATMYHLLTNSEPTPMETPAPGTLRRLVPSVSTATEDVVRRAMRLVPAERFQSAEEMRRALAGALAALPATAQATPARTAAPARTASRPRMAPAATPAASAPAAPAPSLAVTAAGPRCPRCGYRNRASARFCARDGTALRGAESGMQRAPATRVVPAITTAELRLQRATQAFSQGQFHQAVRQGEAALAEGRATPEVCQLLGRAYAALHRPREAATAFGRANQQRPSGALLLEEGLAWWQAGEQTLAQIALTKARALEPRNAEIACALGRLCLEQRHLAQAEGELREALRLRPAYLAALLALAEVQMARKEWPLAVAAYQDALAVDPHSARAHLGVGEAQLADGKTSEAIRLLREAVRLAPESEAAHLALARAYRVAGRTRDAQAAERRAAAVRAHTSA